MEIFMKVLQWGLAIGWAVVFLAVGWLAWITRNKKVDHE